MKVGVVIPAYNEEKRIGNTLKEYSAYFEKIRKSTKKFDYVILVSINNTHDNTLKIVKSYSKKNKRITYINLKKGGKGYAIIEGFKVLLSKKLDILGFVDADNATSPEAFYDLYKNLGTYDGIIASRYLPGAKVKPKQAAKRIIASRVFNFLIRSLFFLRYRDTQCGAKIFKRSVVESIVNKIGMAQWSFDIDLLYKINKNHFIIKEIPTTWSDKEYSKLNFFKAGPRMVFSIIYLRILESPFRRLLIPLRPILKLGDSILNKR